MQFQFIITLADGTVIDTATDNPKGWDDLQLVLQFTERGDWLVEFSNTLAFPDPVYSQIRDYIKGTDPVLDPGSPCAISGLEIRGRCNEYEAFETIVIAKWSGPETEFNCNDCFVSIKPSDTGGIQRLRNFDEEFSLATTRIDLFEIISCSRFEDTPGNADQRGFALVYDWLVAFGASIGVTIDSTILTTPFQELEANFVAPALAVNEVYNLTIETGFGDIFTYSVDGPTTPVETAFRIELQMAQDPRINPIICWKPRKIWRSDAVLDPFAINAGQVTIFAPFEVVNFTETINFVDTGQALNVITDFQYGLEGLAISDKGMDDGFNSNLTLTFSQMWDFLQSIAPFTMRELDGTVFIDPEPVQYAETDPIVANIQVDNYTETIESRWLCGELDVGSDFEHEDYEESIANWTWEPWTQENCVAPGNFGPIDAPITATGPPSTITWNYQNIRGALAFCGQIILDSPISGGAQLEVLVNSGIVHTENITLTAGINGYNLVDPVAANGFFENKEDATFCLPTDSGTIQLRFVGVTITNFIQTLVTFDLQAQFDRRSFDAPVFLREDLHDDKPNYALTTYDCDQVCPIRIPEAFYALPGFGIAQHMKGDVDYKDTFFVTFVDVANNQARLFEVDEYDPSNCPAPPECGEYRRNCYYNLPLQPPFVARNFQPVVPQNIATGGLQIVTNYFPDGCLPDPGILPSDLEYARTRTGVCQVVASDLCLGPEEIRGLLATLRANITTSCDGETFPARWNQLNFSFVDGSVSGVFRRLT